MTQPWIQNKLRDSLFILSPPFLVFILVLFFNRNLEMIPHFYYWIFLVVFIDVAHVYSTLFKTYFVAEEFNLHKARYITIPIVCFLGSVLVYSFDDFLFWRLLAYIALFHFVRQQYGFFKVYSRQEENSKRVNLLGDLAIYSATMYPIIFWFFGPKRNFNWFVDNDFYRYSSDAVVHIAFFLFLIIQLTYIAREGYLYYTTGRFNLPKNAIWLGTLISWNVGIVIYNNDIIFTIFNIVSHGIPYMAIVFFKTSNNSYPENSLLKRFFQHKYTWLSFIFFLLLVGFLEEFIWDIFVWKEQFEKLKGFDLSAIFWIIVPLLSLPQLTHYVLDGYIWRSPKL